MKWPFFLEHVRNGFPVINDLGQKQIRKPTRWLLVSERMRCFIREDAFCGEDIM